MLQLQLGPNAPAQAISRVLSELASLTEAEVNRVHTFVLDLKGSYGAGVEVVSGAGLTGSASDAGGHATPVAAAGAQQPGALQTAPPVDDFQAEVEHFCATYGIDSRVMERLTNLPTEAARAVMSATLDGARFPNAVVGKRCMEAAEGRLPSNMPRQGDWICGGCSAMNFAKRSACHNCGAVPVPAYGGAPMALMPKQPPRPLRPAVPAPNYIPVNAGQGMKRPLAPPPYAGSPGDAVGAFCAQHGLDSVLEARLRQMPPHAAHACMSANLDGVRSIAGTMQGRITRAEQGQLPQNAPRPGDWSCVCGCVNFAKRQECHQCGLPKGGGHDSATVQRIGAFCAEHQLDEGLHASLSQLPDAAADAIMSATLDGARSIPAVLKRRIAAYNHEGRLPENTPRAGDWTCQCGAVNFARRDACHKCGAPRGQNPLDAAGGLMS